MKEIINIVKKEYKITDENYICIRSKYFEDIQLLEFNLNPYVSVKIFKIKDDYNLLLSVKNSNSFTNKNITIKIEYKSLEKLKNDLEGYQFYNGILSFF